MYTQFFYNEFTDVSLKLMHIGFQSWCLAITINSPGSLSVRGFEYLNYYQFELRKAIILKICCKNCRKIALGLTKLYGRLPQLFCSG